MKNLLIQTEILPFTTFRYHVKIFREQILTVDLTLVHCPTFVSLKTIEMQADSIAALPLTTQKYAIHSENWMSLRYVFSCWEPF